jgi:hypothetical protein
LVEDFNAFVPSSCRFSIHILSIINLNVVSGGDIKILKEIVSTRNDTDSS